MAASTTSTASSGTPLVPALAAPGDIALLTIRRPFTVDDYHRMGEVGMLAEDERTELLNGEVVHKMPISSRHAGCVKWLAQRLFAALAGRAVVGVQDPVSLSRRSEPEPDITILRPRDDDYRRSHPEPADVLLLVEVADTSLAVDRSVKAPLYAAAGIPELWIVDLVGDAIEVYRSPSAGGYRLVERFDRGADVRPIAFPDVVVPVDEVLGVA